MLTKLCYVFNSFACTTIRFDTFCSTIVKTTTFQCLVNAIWKSIKVFPIPDITPNDII